MLGPEFILGTCLLFEIFLGFEVMAQQSLRSPVWRYCGCEIRLNIVMYDFSSKLNTSLAIGCWDVQRETVVYNTNEQGEIANLT